MTQERLNNCMILHVHKEKLIVLIWLKWLENLQTMIEGDTFLVISNVIVITIIIIVFCINIYDYGCCPPPALILFLLH